MEPTEPHRVPERWPDISPDPNVVSVREWRTKRLAEARASALISDRGEYLCRLARGKHVLDIGIVEHTEAAARQSMWLHDRLRRAAKTCLGTDILADEIKRLQRRGYNVLCFDVTRGALDDTFELIVCGEVIEHLEKPGHLFANVARMMGDDSRFVLTTPNPWYLNVIRRNLFDGRPYSPSADHVAWYDPGTLCELAERHSLTLERYSGVLVEDARTALGTFILKCQRVLVRFGLRREVFARTIVYEFVRARTR